MHSVEDKYGIQNYIFIISLKSIFWKVESTVWPTALKINVDAREGATSSSPAHLHAHHTKIPKKYQKKHQMPTKKTTKMPVKEQPLQLQPPSLWSSYIQHRHHPTMQCIWKVITFRYRIWKDTSDIKAAFEMYSTLAIQMCLCLNIGSNQWFKEHVCWLWEPHPAMH